MLSTRHPSFTMGKRKCPCKGKYVSPSDGKCPGEFITYGLRKSWRPGCLVFASNKIKVTTKGGRKLVKYCTKSAGGCGKDYRTDDSEQSFCDDCLDKQVMELNDIR